MTEHFTREHLGKNSFGTKILSAVKKVENLSYCRFMSHWRYTMKIVRQQAASFLGDPHWIYMLVYWVQWQTATDYWKPNDLGSPLYLSSGFRRIKGVVRDKQICRQPHKLLSMFLKCRVSTQMDKVCRKSIELLLWDGVQGLTLRKMSWLGDASAMNSNPGYFLYLQH